MKTLAAVLVCACLASALASPSWVHLENETVSATDKVSFKVALKPQNLEHLDSLFWSLSDPKSPFYGKFLNNDQIADLISLPESDLQRVENWLSKETVCDFNMRRSVHRDYLLVDTCVAQAQKIFPNLLPAVYEKEGTTDRIIRSKILVDLEENLYLLGVPTDLHELIAGVHEVTDVPMHWSRIGGDLYPILPWKLFDKELHISDILSYFSVSNSGIKDTTYTADNGQVKQSVIEFNNAAFAASDLADFQSRYGIPSNPIQKVVGKQSGALSLEAALDVQTITGIAQKVATWDFVFDSTATFIDVTETIMGTEGAPKVISCSWGGPESLLGKSAATAANISFMKFGLKGFTFLTAAGDSGPSLNPKDCNEYEAQFPGSSPYVLTVGGSSVEDFTHTQQAWIHSSGGFSSYFPRPAFQNDAVEHYLKTADMPSNTDGRYTTTGRAFPDVSGFGAYYPVCSSGSYQPIGGTSGAAPQFAGVISLINLHRYQNGLGPLGAVTPALYSLKNGVGTDITHGETYATSRYGCKGKYLDGYKAAAGWDATTGLGNPDFETLLAALGDLKSA